MPPGRDDIPLNHPRRIARIAWLSESMLSRESEEVQRLCVEYREKYAKPAGLTAGPVKYVFPRNPERDELGNAVLYPGLPRFAGVAALFNTPHGEVVILAPTMEALDEQVRYMGITGCISKEKCMITEGRRIP